jgi:hypothetical protein
MLLQGVLHIIDKVLVPSLESGENLEDFESPPVAAASLDATPAPPPEVQTSSDISSDAATIDPVVPMLLHGDVEP